MKLIFDFIFICIKNKFLLLGAVIVLAIVGLGASYLIKPTFVAKTRILAPQQNSGLSAALGSLSAMGAAVPGSLQLSGAKGITDQWLGLLNSRIVIDGLIEKFKLKEYYDVKFRFLAQRQLASSTNILAGKDGFIDIEVEDTNPVMAAALANGYVDLLQDASKKIAIGEAANRRKFLEIQMNKAREDLKKALELLSKSGPNGGLIKIAPEALIAARAQLTSRIQIQEAKVAAMQVAMTGKNAEVVQAASELAILKKQLADLDTQNDGGVNSGSYLTALRSYKYAEIMHESIAKQYEFAKADEAREGGVIQVVDKADMPEWKAKPSRLGFALGGALLGFVLAFAYILIKHTLAHLAMDPELSARYGFVSGSQGS